MRNIHLIGVCGTAMATLAAMLKRSGHSVRGSDQDVYPPMSDFLAAEGIAALSGYAAEHITSDLDLVVVGNAISRGNPELEEVLDRKIRYCSLPDAVREQFLWAARSIVIAGTHGKTTTTALAGWVLTSGGADPSVLVGGIAKNFGEPGRGGASYRMGQGREFVIEGDEYDSAFFDKTAKFLKYLPDVAVVNNIEFDHADIYADLDAVMLAFRRLVNLVPRKGLLIIGADSPRAAELQGLAKSRLETFGTSDTGPDLTWQAHDIEPAGATTRFKVRRHGMPFGAFDVPLVGMHNVRNALAAIAVATDAGLGVERIDEGLRTFAGVKRRLEVVGVVDGVTLYDDFAHHPTAVAETLAGLRASNPEARIWAVFEPRSASSCRRIFQDDFARAFAAADEVLIAPVFRSSLPDAERLSVPQLVRDLNGQGTSAREADSIDDIVTCIAREHRPGDLVVLMSNGGFGGIHKKLLQALERPHVNDINDINSRVRPAGDSAVIVEFEERIDRAVNDRVLALVRSIEAAGLAGIRDVVPTYRSATVYFDPLKTDVMSLVARLEIEADRPGGEPMAESARSPIRIPVCYGTVFGPDLEEVAAFGRMDAEEVVSLHCGRTYRVFMLGFLPGFAYLAPVDERIAVPRLAAPRARVPAGSVGIAGTQTGIYPAESPGGWKLIGRTPVKPFDAQRSEPFLLKAGDHVEFYPVDEAAYRDLARAGSAGAEARA